MSTEPVPTPEHDKMRAGHHQALVTFLLWLGEEGYLDPYLTHGVGMDEIAASYLGVDPDKLVREKEAMLRRLLGHEEQ
jgi:hypothetical protein